MQAAELLDQLRQPVHGDAGVGGDADGVLLMGVYQGDFPLQRLIGGKALLYHGQDPLSGRGQTDAAPVTHQHGKADLPFQTVHHMGQAGLGIAQLLRRPGKAALFCGRGQCFQFFTVHGNISFFAGYHRFYHEAVANATT